MRISVDAKELWESVKNATLLSSSTGPGVFLGTSPGCLELIAVDEFSALSTSVMQGGIPDGLDVVFEHKAINELEKRLRSAPSTLIDLVFEGELCRVADIEVACAPPKDSEYWEKVAEILWSSEATTIGAHKVNPERLSKLSRLEPKGEWPLNLCITEGFIRWEYGERTHGVITAIEEE